MRKFFELIATEKKQDLAEYALLATLFLLVAIACVTLLDEQIQALVASVRTVF